MKEKKQRVNVWLDPDIINKVDGLVKRFNVENQSQLIAKAVEFFIGYVGANDSTAFLSDTLVGVIDGSIKECENRNATNLFRFAVEMEIIMQILAAGLDIPKEYIERLRVQAVNTVKSCNGKICFEDALKISNEEDYA